MSKRKGGADSDNDDVPSRLSRLDLSGVKRKPGDGEEIKVERRKALRQIESPYTDLRRQWMAAFPVAPIVAPSLLDPKKHSFLDHVITLVNMRDEAGLLRMLDQDKIDPKAMPGVFQTVVRSNLLSVINKLVLDYPQADLEEAVQDAIRFPTCKPVTMKLLLTLWADEHGETVEAAAKQMLDKAGADSIMLDPLRLRVLCEMAGVPVPGLDEEEEAKKKKPLAEEKKQEEIELKALPLSYDDASYSNSLSISSECVFTPDGKRVVLGTFASRWAVNGKLSVFDVETHEMWDILDVTAVRTIVAAPDNKTVYTANWDKISVVDLEQKKKIREIHTDRPNAQDEGICAIALNPNGAEIASGDGTGRVVIHDTGTGQVIRELQIPEEQSQWGIKTLAYSPDGALLLAVLKTPLSPATAWNTQTGQRSTFSENVRAVAFSPTEPLIAIVWLFSNNLDHAFVDLLDVASFQLRQRFRLPSGTWPRTIAFSPGGTRLLVSGEQFVVIDIEAKTIVYRSRLRKYLSHTPVAFSPVDYRVMVAGGLDSLYLELFDFRDRPETRTLQSVVSSGLANSIQPQSAWDQFLSRGMYDPRLLGFIFGFNAKMG